MTTTHQTAAVVYRRMLELLPPQKMHRITVRDVERLLTAEEVTR